MDNKIILNSVDNDKLSLMESIFTKPNPPLAAVQLESFSLQTGLNLPEAYKAFLLKNNGGYTKNLVFQGGNETIFFNSLYGIYLNSELDAIKEWNYRIEEGDYYQNYFPICEDSGNNLITINLNNQTIHFWNHEFLPGNNYKLIADSFEKFLSSIKLDDDQSTLEEFDILAFSKSQSIEKLIPGNAKILLLDEIKNIKANNYHISNNILEKMSDWINVYKQDSKLPQRKPKINAIKDSFKNLELNYKGEDVEYYLNELEVALNNYR